MLLMRLIGFLMGYVTFTARNGFPERFINLCRIAGIPLRNLTSKDSVITAQTDRTQYKRIRSVARKSGMTVRIKKKHGLPFFLRNHRRRFGLIAGAVFCIISVMFFSTRIWRIEIIGNTRVSSEEIADVFASLGVRTGVSSSNIDQSATEREALSRLPEITWANINFSGCTAVIEVRETVAKPDETDNNTVSNIVAAHDGRIIMMRPFSGTPEEKTGSAVIKGDLLISGIKENKDKTLRFCRAEGYVVAETVRCSEFSLRQKFVAARKIGSHKSYMLHFLLWDIPLGKRPKNAFSDKTLITVNGVSLPAGISSFIGIDYAESEHILNNADATLLATLRYAEARSEEFRGKEIKNSRIDLAVKEGCVNICGEFDCIENIAAESPFEIENTP